ncbi:hypothetical protein BKI52_36905 [marine bacterium AO1-C]|nr:hypothetical protein BKI52_36905 [marine bacterium AO1-C]
MLCCIPVIMSSKAQTSYDQLHIYTINKNTYFSTYQYERDLKEVGRHIKYTIKDPQKVVLFGGLLKQMPMDLKKKKRVPFKSGGGYVFLEFTNHKGDTLTCGFGRNNVVFVNGYDTSLDAKAILEKYLKSYISPTLNWHGKYNTQKQAKYRLDEEKDGYEVVYPPAIQKLLEKGKPNYFVGDVSPLATESLNKFVIIGIEVKNRRVVSTYFPMNFEDNIRGGMNETVYKKYLQVLTYRLRILTIKNPHKLKADIIYRMLDFNN